MNNIFIFANIIFTKKKNNKLMKIIIRVKFKKKLLNKYIIKKNRKVIKLT